MVVLSSVLEVLGLVAVVAGVALFDWRAALVVAGVGLVLLGYFLSAPRAEPHRPDGRLE